MDGGETGGTAASGALAGARPADAGYVLEATGLRRSFGTTVAVDGVDIRIHPGETYGLLGPNGAGKTTTISMIAGLLTADAGEVRVAGEQLTTRSVAAKALVGIVPQELAIYPGLTARENLAFFGRLYGLRRAARRDRIAEVLDIIGLTDRADEKTETFSGGMQRRLNVGIGLLHQPRLLILDEPTVGVDPQSRNAILESVEKLAGAGMAVLYTTHYMEEAERLCERVAIIDEGRLRAEGTRRELISLVGQLDRVALTATGPVEAAARRLSGLEGVESASATPDGAEVMALDAGAVLPQVMAAAAEAGVQVSAVRVAEPDLEAVFLHLTGKALRD